MFAHVTEFMLLQDKCEERHLIPGNRSQNIAITDLAVTWNSENNTENHPILHKINLNIKPGELVIIIGLVGSGKSSLLSALIGDMKIVSGRVEISPSVAYVPQEPWIMLGTVRENIVLGSRVNEEHYWEVVRMCGLLPDLSQMKKGDLTVIGDRGSTISGGQKARIALARAVYRESEVYLLDDPLSAVDAQVGLHIFNECILKGLHTSTRLLVTHHHKYLPYADRVILFHEGSISLQGTYEEVRDKPELQAVLSLSDVRNTAKIPTKNSILRGTWDDVEFSHSIKEDQDVGSVPNSVYFQYLLLFYRSKAVLGLIFLLLTALQIVYLSSFYWVSYWAGQSIEEQRNPYFVYVLAGIVLLLIGISTFRNYILLKGMAVSNLNLHNLAVEAVTATDLSFFDTNSQGNIMSRFTKDVSVIEDLLIRYLSDWIILAALLISYFLSLVVTMPLNILALGVVVFVGKKITVRFVPPIRNLKRSELSTKADLVGLTTSTISGISTIRSLNLTAHFQARFSRAVSLNFRAWFCFFVNQRVLQLLNDYLGMLFVSLNALTCVILKETVSADVLAVGFAFTVLMISYLGWFWDVYINTGNFMISAQRLFKYVELKPEQDEFPEAKLKVTKGEIVFKNACLRYASDLDLALKNLNFTINGGMKVGIVGRTGAGKSSLLLALFRLKELCSGAIYIDGQDTASVSLRSLRSQLAVIPQSPLLFHGDVRRNIDPTHTHTSTDINAVLEELQLVSFAETDVSQLSTGQKQLLCLARSLLRDSQIVVFDEATGNIDPKTEDFVQTVIRSKLCGKTMMIIAHRLKTVRKCDLVVVLEQGECVELGPPDDLERQGAYFSQMLQASESS